MSRNRLLTCAALALVTAFSVPATAQAGAGPGDDLTAALQPPANSAPFILLSTATDPHIAGFQVDTSAYTTEVSEPVRCPQRTYTTTYGKTVWATFKAPQFGRLDVTAAGFDSVISLFDASANGAGIGCVDRLAGKIESFPRDSLPTVKKNHTYFVQIGGAQQPDSSFVGGPLAVDLELIRPEVTVGDAVLSWLGGGGGVRIKSLSINAPRGSAVAVGCLNKSCGKLRSFAVQKPVFRQKIGGSLAPRLAAYAVPAERTFADPSASAAAGPKLNGKRIKNGDTLVVAVQRPDQIGVLYFWRVARNAAGTKEVRCIEPGSLKFKRVGTCTGQ
jgi:hypothetical protein